jgi:hypothetical protein
MDIPWAPTATTSQYLQNTDNFKFQTQNTIATNFKLKHQIPLTLRHQIPPNVATQSTANFATPNTPNFATQNTTNSATQGTDFTRHQDRGKHQQSTIALHTTPR